MAGIEDGFPEGSRVLVVDDSLTCLRILELLLQKCKYEVTGTREATEALRMLRENPKKYDIVISDVHMPVMDGFQLLENIRLHMDIPVIMLSANADHAQVMRGIKYGAVDYLIKPVRIAEMKNIWQHIARKKIQNKKEGKTIAVEREEVGAHQSSDGKGGTSQVQEAEPETQKRKANDDDDDGDGSKIDNHGPSGSKRQRIVWTRDLHKKFVNVIDHLGLENAFPKKILEIMNVEGLTREHVASHLQKYKLYLKRMTQTTTMGQFAYPPLTPFGAHNSSLFHPREAMFNPYAPFTNLEPPLLNSSMGLRLSFKPSTMNSSMGYMVGIPGVNQFQMNTGQVTTGGPSAQGVEGLANHPSLPTQYSGYMAQHGILNLQDQTKYMENWQNNNATIMQNQAPPTSINGEVYSTRTSHLQNTSERALINAPGSSQYPFPLVAQSRRFNPVELQEYGGDLTKVVNTSNGGDHPNMWFGGSSSNPIGEFSLQEHGGDSTNVVNTSNGGDQPNMWFGGNSSNPYGAFANPTYGHVARINTSSGLQNIEAQAHEADALLNIENFLFDDSDLLDDNDSLTNILQGFQD